MCFGTCRIRNMGAVSFTHETQKTCGREVTCMRPPQCVRMGARVVRAGRTPQDVSFSLHNDERKVLPAPRGDSDKTYAGAGRCPQVANDALFEIQIASHCENNIWETYACNEQKRSNHSFPATLLRQRCSSDLLRDLVQAKSTRHSDPANHVLGLP
jgi:hypothetical protein